MYHALELYLCACTFKHTYYRLCATVLLKLVILGCRRENNLQLCNIIEHSQFSSNRLFKLLSNRYYLNRSEDKVRTKFHKGMQTRKMWTLIINSQGGQDTKRIVLYLNKDLTCDAQLALYKNEILVITIGACMHDCMSFDFRRLWNISVMKLGTRFRK